MREKNVSVREKMKKNLSFRTHRNKGGAKQNHRQMQKKGRDCTLEWNSGGHFKDADLRTAKAFQWVMEEHA